MTLKTTEGVSNCKFQHLGSIISGQHWCAELLGQWKILVIKWMWKQLCKKKLCR